MSCTSFEPLILPGVACHFFTVNPRIQKSSLLRVRSRSRWLLLRRCRGVAGCRLRWRSLVVNRRRSRSVATRRRNRSRGNGRRSGLRRSHGRRCRGRVIALQLEEDRRNLKRHLVARVHVRVNLRVQLVHHVIPRIGLQPAAQRKRRRCCRSSQFSFGDMCCRSAIHGVPSTFSSESPSFGVFNSFSAFSRSTSCA